MPKSKRKPRQDSRRKKGSPSHGLAQISLGYDPTGRMDNVDIRSTKQGWTEVELVDGTVIRSRPVLLEVKRAVGQFNKEGDPVYLMNFTLMNQVKAPAKLKKKTG
jgi:hypothetical protein